MRVVIDTNVVIAGLRCSGGASHAIIRLVFAGRLRPVLSVHRPQASGEDQSDDRGRC